jgi:thiamine-monophosphate kinase
LPTEDKPQRRKIAEESLGEHEIIELMRKRFTPMPTIAVGFGDDASAVYLDAEGKVAVLKTDMLVAKTDVPIGMSLWQAARKAIVMNVSDFAAKGVQPQVVLVSLGLAKALSRQDIQSIADGLDAGAREYGAFVVGGDTGEASDLVIAVELFGVADKDSMMLRRGTRPGDILAVTGLFGRSAAGLRALQNKNPVTSKTLEKRLQESVNMPHARLKEGLALAGSRAVSACMDSSDGLAWCLHEMATQNDVGFVISDLPMDDQAAKFARANRLQAEDLALYGGEEYELVLTVRPELWDKAASSVEKVGGKLLHIGKATTDKRILLQDKNGEKRVIERRGYEHFKN